MGRRRGPSPSKERREELKPKPEPKKLLFESEFDQEPVQYVGKKPPKMPSKAITLDGHDFFEALSALQKSVRRNKEGDALYWAYQLSQFNPIALWNRLKVFASEEVGLASPQTVLLVRALFENWRDVSLDKDGKLKSSGEGGLFIAHAVVVLCRAEKNSLAVNAACIMTILPKREVPDYALDRHTHRGKTMGRGWGHFFDVGAFRENLDKTIPDVYLEHVRKNIEKIYAKQMESKGKQEKGK